MRIRRHMSANPDAKLFSCKFSVVLFSSASDKCFKNEESAKTSPNLIPTSVKVNRPERQRSHWTVFKMAFHTLPFRRSGGGDTDAEDEDEDDLFGIEGGVSGRRVALKCVWNRCSRDRARSESRKVAREARNVWKGMTLDGSRTTLNKGVNQRKKAALRKECPVW